MLKIHTVLNSRQCFIFIVLSDNFVFLSVSEWRPSNNLSLLTSIIIYSLLWQAVSAALLGTAPSVSLPGCGGIGHPLLWPPSVTGGQDQLYWRHLCAWNQLEDDEILQALQHGQLVTVP